MDNRITIRLLPRELKALRHITQAFAEHRNLAAMLGLGAEDIAMAKDALMHLPVLVPGADTDNQQPATNN